jgi:tripartite-type tricarboxylate transporter receptor subunit TctC
MSGLPRGVLVQGVVLLSLVLGGCSRQLVYPHRPITLIVPWAAGGGTDRVARQVAAHLEQELGTPVSVVNATGGKGVTGHNRGITARPDGYTLTMATLELNMMHWSGLTDLTHDDCLILMSVNEDCAALFVRDDAPWGSLRELEAAIRQQPQQLKASGTSSGAAWHLALSGWLLAAGMSASDVVWVSSTGANPSLQELLSGGVDMVCCSLPEAESLHRAGEIRAIGVMAPQPVRGYDEVPTFASQGRAWSLGGWRAVAVPQGTPPAVVARLEEALKRIVTGQTRIVSRTSSNSATPGTNGRRAETVEQTFPEFMEQAGFDHTWRNGERLTAFLKETDAKFGELLTSEAMRSVNRDRFSAQTWPSALLWLLAAVGGLLALVSGLSSRGLSGSARTDRGLPAHRSDEATPVLTASSPRLPVSQRGVFNFVVIVGAILCYALLAETLGFLVTAGGVLFVLLWWLGNSVRVSAAITVVIVPVVWQLFGSGLRVPLPDGVWGG